MINRTDKNQQAIMDCFKTLGYSCLSLVDVKRGCPDLLISKGENILVEIKTEKGKLNDLQKQFVSRWHSAVYLVRSVEDCIALDAGTLEPITVDEIKRKK